MSSFRVAVSLACLVAVSSLGVYFWLFRDAEAPHASDPVPQLAPTEREHTGENGVAPKDVEIAALGLRASDVAAADERKTVPVPLLSGRVVDTTGTAIVGAIASWTARVERDRDASVDVEASERTTVWSTSDSNGEFRFPDAPADLSDFSSVLWITHAAHEAISVALDRDRGAWSSLASLPMTPAHGIRCTVVDDSNRGVPLATVEQRAHLSGDPASDKPDVALRRLLHRSVQADADGRAMLSPFPGEQRAQAFGATGMSEPRIARNGDTLTLVLRPTFTVEGKIHGLADLGDIEGVASVVCQAQRGNVVRTLATSRFEDEEHWGPVTLPALAGQKYRFFLQGGKLAPNARIIDAPSGGKLTVDLLAEVGNDVWFHIADEGGSPLPEAQAIVTWTRDGYEFEASARPREDGFTLVRGCPSGSMVCEARCRGYRSQRHFPETLPEVVPVSRGFRLLPAGRLKGRCVHAGKPVRDFDVIVWPRGDASNYRRHSFSDREDGTFEIDDAPRGDVMVLGGSATLPPSQVRQLTVQADAVTEVLIELPESLQGRGKVVAGGTNEPLVDALVQPYSIHEHDEIACLSPPISVDAEGKFEIDALAPGRNVCAVSAPGFATTWAEVHGVSGEIAEFGVITLSPRQSLTARLLSDGTDDLSDFWIRLTGPDAIPIAQFPASGELVFDSVSPGRYEIDLRRGFRSKDGGAFVLRNHATFESGNEDWQIELRISGGCKVVVEIEPESGQPLPEGLIVATTCSRSDDEGITRYWPVPEGGVVTCDGILPGHLGVDVATTAERFASEHINIAPDDRERRVRVSLSKRHNAFPVRVVDADEKPVPDVRVSLVLFLDGTMLHESSDANGECTFRAIDPGRYRVQLFHQARGWAIAVPIELKNGETATVKFEPDGSVQALLLDGQEPQKAVRCMLWDKDKSYGFSTMSSDENGMVRTDKLSTGAYLLEVQEPGYWRAVTSVRCVKDAGPTPVQVRRTGDVELEVRTTAGLPVAQIAVGLFAVDLAEDVATWIADGRVKTPKHGLVTGSDGKLRVDGLPHGTYRWSLTAGGEQHEGNVVVPPKSVGRAAIVLP